LNLKNQRAMNLDMHFMFNAIIRMVAKTGLLTA